MDKRLLPIISFLALLGCQKMSYPKTLELPDAQFTVRRLERGADGSISLHLSGFIFHSSLAVDEVVVSRGERSMTVVISLTPVRKGKDGNFDVLIPLANEKEEVLFGKQLAIVWPIEQSEH